MIFTTQSYGGGIAHDAIQRRRDATTGELYWVFDNKRFKNGFLHKEVNYRSLQVTGVNPTIDELQRWNQKTERDEDKGDDDENSKNSSIDGTHFFSYSQSLFFLSFLWFVFTFQSVFLCTQNVNV
jgi:hypothetical protein